jgi:Cu2+-containing amine oxidase
MKRFVLLAFLLPLLPAARGGQVSPRAMSAAEETAVLEVAEKAVKAEGLWKGKVVLTNAEVVPDDAAKPPRRCAVLTYYRYEGDLGIVVCVDVDNRKLVSLRSEPHLPTSLTPEEIAEAEKLARADPRVQKALAFYKHLERIEVDTIVAQIINPEVPGHQHRVARLFFRDHKRNYLNQVPMVDVDLTTGEVRLDVIPNMHGKK